MIDDDSANLTLRPVSLLPWDEDQLREYLQRRGFTAEEEQGRTAAAKLGERDRSLLTKPFFASEFPEFVKPPSHANAPDSLLDYLIEAYIARETGKVLGASGDPILSASGHRTLLEESAEFMWQSEKRQVSTADLQTLVEMIAEEEGLGGDETRQIITKVTSSAGFRTSTNQGAGAIHLRP